MDMDWVRQAFRTVAGPIDRAAPAGHHAVVAAILRQTTAGAEILLIRRAEDERDPWSGHMALPGGHRSAADVDLVATAAREISEEVGLDLLRHAELLGRLASTRAVAQNQPLDFAIFPLVFALASDIEPTGNPREVQEIVWARVDHLLSPAARSSHEYRLHQERHRFPAFDVGGHSVWGLTFRILESLLEVLAARAGAVGADDPKQ
jgi:8-oxo-dGTP pyrophosphatase MutT (NUDIX family)